MKINIFTSGKDRCGWIDSGISEYEKRLMGSLSFSWRISKRSSDLERAIKGEKRLIGLDPTGELFSSESFSTWLFEEIERGGAKVSFVIGGMEGLTESMHISCARLISLSPMTFTHQMTRLLLCEQIYRAYQIHTGRPYHR